jgi:hypothetical protein
VDLSLRRLQFLDASDDAVYDFIGGSGIEKDGFPSWYIVAVWAVSEACGEA